MLLLLLCLQATEPQPGLRMLLEGDVGTSPSQFSLDRDSLHPAPAPPGSARSHHSAAAPPGSARSHHSAAAPPGSTQSHHSAAAPPGSARSHHSAAAPPGSARSHHSAAAPPGSARSRQSQSRHSTSRHAPSSSKTVDDVVHIIIHIHQTYYKCFFYNTSIVHENC